MLRSFTIVLLTAFFLFLASCGGSSKSNTTTTPPADDTTDQEVTSVPWQDELSRVWSGSWTNLTFNSTGPARIDANVSGNSVTLTTDVDGLVFGLFNPDAETLTGTISGGNGSWTFQVESETFGTVTINVTGTDGTFNFTASSSNVPTASIASFSASGILDSTSLTGSATITFAGGGMANTTFTFEPAS